MQVVTTSEYFGSFDAPEEALTFMHSLLDRYTAKQMFSLTIVPRKVYRMIPMAYATVWDATVVLKQSEVDEYRKPL